MMTNEDEEIYNNAQICWICKEELNTDKVRDYLKKCTSTKNYLI